MAASLYNVIPEELENYIFRHNWTYTHMYV